MDVYRKTRPIRAQWLTNGTLGASTTPAAPVHGSSRAYEWNGPGGNYHMDALQASLLTVKLGALEHRLLADATVFATHTVIPVSTWLR